MERNKEILSVQKELSKMQLYDQTLVTQDQVIKTLQQNLEKCVQKQQNFKKLLENINKVQQENELLKKQIEEEAKNGHEDEDLDTLREEVTKLRQIKEQLTFDLNRQKPILTEEKQLEEQKIMLQIEVEKYRQRVIALETQLYKDSKEHAEQLVQMEEKLAEKKTGLFGGN